MLEKIEPLRERLPHLFKEDGYSLINWIPVIGERVGAYMVKQAGNSEITLFFGFGIYKGNFLPPVVHDFSEGGTFIAGDIEIVVEPATGDKPYDHTRPKISLERGGEVWGNECWWRPAEEFANGILKERPVKNVGIDEYRRQFEERYSEN